MGEDYKQTERFEFYAGEDKDLRFTTTDRDGNAVDINGFSIGFAIWPSRYSSTKIVDYPKGDSNITITDSSHSDGGKFTVRIDAADTEGHEGEDRWYQAWAEDANSEKQVLATGYIDLLENNS